MRIEYKTTVFSGGKDWAGQPRADYEKYAEVGPSVPCCDGMAESRGEFLQGSDAVLRSHGREPRRVSALG